MKQDFKNNMVERLMAIVSYLASTDTPKRLTDIARDLRLSKASTLRILHSLEKGQWVITDPNTGMYKIGYRIMGMGLSILSNTPIAAMSLPYLTELRDVTNETIGLSIRVENERMFIEDIQSNRELRFIPPMGKRLPLWIGAAGKVILANMAKKEITAVLDKLRIQTPKLDSGEPLNITKLNNELAQIRKEGCSVSIGERESGTAAVAAAIFNRHNEVIGAVTIAGPIERFNKNVIKKYCKLIKITADNINQQTGATISGGTKA
jgi:DNA-binding IclR family transcriptional regulator